jgi:ribosomal protein S18 acetylase RimI-like enzyme
MLAIQRRHPKGPYAQLVVLGVDLLAQGRGLAGSLLRSAIVDWDARGVATYLETSKERNISIYQRYGFEVIDVLSIPNGPNVWFMWRQPAT